MAGLIREEDIALVRERADIVEVVRAYVTLKSAGGGSLKGLCPFHDEKSPSFTVRPGRGFYCFGCGEGGDVFEFLMKHDGLTFGQAVEYLADRTGLQVRRTETDDRTPKQTGPSRKRLAEANRFAQEFYAEALQSPEAQIARDFLSGRGFDAEVSARFGLGFAPRDGNALYKALRHKQYSDAELVAAGLVAQSERGHYDRFRGRLLWPIRDAAADTIGFGARRLFDDDRIEAKYLNTPETALYKKSQVLYGLDLARREISRTRQAVVVEGYTDVMACHLAGVTTAVAACGTAFGDEQGKVIKRLLLDHDEFRGEVIFTFDGDTPGQKAALAVFRKDQQLVGQAYVAVEPDGLDPCDLRLQKGDAAVRELIARRIPLYRFALTHVIGQYDLDRADARIDALREAARFVSAVRDPSKVDAFAREIAGMVGVEVEQARTEVRRAARGGAPVEQRQARPQRAALPDHRDPRFALERETLKLVVQQPQLVGRYTADLAENDFTHPLYLAIWETAAALGGPASAGDTDMWVSAVRGSLAAQFPAVAGQPAHPVMQVLNALAVEPIPATNDPAPAYAAACVFRLQEVTVMRRLAELKSRLQRTNPVEQEADYKKMFGELVALESHRRALRERAIGVVD